MPMFRETAGTGKWDNVKRVRRTRRAGALLWAGEQGALRLSWAHAEHPLPFLVLLPARGLPCVAGTLQVCPTPALPPARPQFVMGSLAMKATERDPDFLKNFDKAVGNKRKTGACLFVFGVQERWQHDGGTGRASVVLPACGLCPCPSASRRKAPPTWPSPAPPSRPRPQSSSPARWAARWTPWCGSPPPASPPPIPTAPLAGRRARLKRVTNS